MNSSDFRSIGAIRDLIANALYQASCWIKYATCADADVVTPVRVHVVEKGPTGTTYSPVTIYGGDSFHVGGELDAALGHCPFFVERMPDEHGIPCLQITVTPTRHLGNVN